MFLPLIKILTQLRIVSPIKPKHITMDLKILQDLTPQPP